MTKDIIISKERLIKRDNMIREQFKNSIETNLNKNKYSFKLNKYKTIYKNIVANLWDQIYFFDLSVVAINDELVYILNCYIEDIRHVSKYKIYLNKTNYNENLIRK